MVYQIQNSDSKNTFTRLGFSDTEKNLSNQSLRLKKSEQPDEFVVSENSVEDKISDGKVSPKSRKKYVYAIGTSTLVVGFGVLALMRGLPKGTNRFLDKIKTFLENRLEKSSRNGKDKLQEFYISSLRKLDNVADKAQSVNNLTSIKDALFKHYMEKTSITSKIHSGITNLFEKISRRTIVKTYGATKKRFIDMNSAFTELDKKLLEKDPNRVVTYNGSQYTVKELVEMARLHRKNVLNSVVDFMSDGNQKERYNYIKSATDNLYQQFWDENFKSNLKEFFSLKNKFLRKEMWQTYITAEKIVESRQKLVNSVSLVRNKISYAPQDKANIVRVHLKNLEQTLAPSDREGRQIIKQLKWYLKNPEDLTGANANNVTALVEKLSKRPFEEKLPEQILKSQETSRLTHTNAIMDLFRKNDSGELQQMLDIYKTIDGFEVAPLEKTVQKTIKSFDKALDLETVQFFSKVSDLQLGSAPTDVLSILASCGMIGYGLVNAKNGDERWDVVFTSGIPIVGAITTSLVCAAKLVSGGKGLLTTIVSGFALKYVGEFANYLRLKVKQGENSPKELAQ